MVWLNFLDKTFDTIFSSKNRNKIESYTLYASILGFIIHLILIYIKNYNILNIGFSGSLLDDPISAIYTPFSIILFYETYLLIFYLPRSFTTAISKQFEIISLINFEVFGECSLGLITTVFPAAIEDISGSKAN